MDVKERLSPFLCNNIVRTLVSVQAVRKRIAYPMRSALCVAGLGLALLGHNAANAAEHAGAGSIVCAEREVLLMVLVEAHGAAPNAAIDKLAAESLGLIQARTACSNGKAPEAIAFYDRLIGDLTAALPQKDNNTSQRLIGAVPLDGGHAARA
jgi:hypothetical protein